MVHSMASYKVYSEINGYDKVQESLSYMSNVIKGTKESVDRFPLNGKMTRVDPERVLTFAKSNVCICCGLVGTVLRSERIEGCTHKMFGKPHLNLYGFRNEKPVMITVDHIILRSEGGEDTHENYNTMCKDCNTRRGNKYSELQDFLNMCKIYPLDKYLLEKEEKANAKLVKKQIHEARRDAKIAKNLEKKKRQENHQKMNAERKLEKQQRLNQK